MLAKTQASFLCALCAAPTAFCTLAKNDAAATEINSGEGRLWPISKIHFSQPKLKDFAYHGKA